jgi:hypothetical protein
MFSNGPVSGVRSGFGSCINNASGMHAAACIDSWLAGKRFRFDKKHCENCDVSNAMPQHHCITMIFSQVET